MTESFMQMRSVSDGAKRSASAKQFSGCLKQMFGRRVRYEHSFLSAESVKKHVILFSFRTIHDIIE